MNKTKLFTMILNLGRRKLIIGGITATLTLGVTSGTVYYNNLNKENQNKGTQIGSTELAAAKVGETQSVVSDNGMLDSNVTSKEVLENPKVEGENTEDSTTENKPVTTPKIETNILVQPKDEPKAEVSKKEEPEAEQPIAMELIKPSELAQPSNPYIPVGYNQEVTDKINAINSYGGDQTGVNTQAYINVCKAIASGQGFDKESLSAYFEGKETYKYLGHTDNVVTRSEPMSYFHDYKNPAAFNDGFKYTVAYWTGSTWKLHCITIKNA